MIEIKETNFRSIQYEVNVVATNGTDELPLGRIYFELSKCVFSTNGTMRLSTGVIKEIGREMDALEYQIKTGIRQKDGRLHNA